MDTLCASLTGDADPSLVSLVSSLGTVMTRRRDRVGKLYRIMKGAQSPTFQPCVLVCMSSRLLMLTCDCSSSSTTAWICLLSVMDDLSAVPGLLQVTLGFFIESLQSTKSYICALCQGF